MNCDICEKPATVKAKGGPVMKTADACGDSYGFDRPHPENYTFRCEDHESKPDAAFGRLWLWQRLERKLCSKQ